MNLYPIFADLRGRRVLVVGGGTVAERKIDALLKSGARVSVRAISLNETLARQSDDGVVDFRPGEFVDDDLRGAWLVVAATNNVDVNRRVAAAARDANVWTNIVDDAELSTFHVPAVIDRSPVTIAISSGGSAPMLARWLRERLEVFVDHAVGAMGALLQRRRPDIRARFRDVNARRRFYARLFSGNVWRRLRARDEASASREIDRLLQTTSEKLRGSVALVGAGPGNPDLLTIGALRALNEADVILHDRLVGSGVLELARRDAIRIDVGKISGGDHNATQDRIHRLMLHHARAGLRVVRLKGGDPFIFGRGGEELEFLRAHDVDYEVVPGITAAIACAAYAGVPLTHRDHARSVHLVTAHGRASLDDVDWPTLSRERQTLAFYMGVSQLGVVRAKLIEHGRARDTPFAIVENGAKEKQRVVIGKLNALERIARAQRVQAPALLIVGEVAAFATKLGWFGASTETARAVAA